MNRIYRLRWSPSRAQWVVASELARRSIPARMSCRHGRAVRHILALSSLGCWLLGASAAWAGGPTGGQVTAGVGRITQSGNTTTIDQTSQTLSLSWQSFNVGPRDTVTFDQP